MKIILNDYEQIILEADGKQYLIKKENIDLIVQNESGKRFIVSDED
jgi:hypothetical protein